MRILVSEGMVIMKGWKGRENRDDGREMGREVGVKGREREWNGREGLREEEKKRNSKGNE